MKVKTNSLALKYTGGYRMSRQKESKEEKTNLKEEKPSSKELGAEKQKAIDAAVLQIEKHFGKGSIMLLGKNPRVDVPAIPTGAIALDVAIGVGGIPRGRE